MGIIICKDGRWNINFPFVGDRDSRIGGCFRIWWPLVANILHIRLLYLNNSHVLHGFLMSLVLASFVLFEGLHYVCSGLQVMLSGVFYLMCKFFEQKCFLNLCGGWPKIFFCYLACGVT